MNCKIDSPCAVCSLAFITNLVSSRSLFALVIFIRSYRKSYRNSLSRKKTIYAAVDDPEEYLRNIREVILFVHYVARMLDRRF